MIQTVDFFTPVVDDPYLFGQIAAANALSDVYAMGGEPKVALNLAAFPDCLDIEILGKILQGGADIGLPGRYRLPQRGQRAAAESGVFCRACIEKSPLGGYQLFNLHALALLWFIVVWVVAVSIACYNALVNIVFAGAAPRLSENERALPCGRRLRNTCKTEERRE